MGTISNFPCWRVQLSTGKYEVSGGNFKAIETGNDSLSKGKPEVSGISVQDEDRELNENSNYLNGLGNIVPSKQYANTNDGYIQKSCRKETKKEIGE